MASDTPPVYNSEGEEVVAPRRRKEAVSYDAGLAPTCMIWFVFIGLALLIGIEVIWGLSHLDAITR